MLSFSFSPPKFYKNNFSKNYITKIKKMPTFKSEKIWYTLVREKNQEENK